MAAVEKASLLSCESPEAEQSAAEAAEVLPELLVLAAAPLGEQNVSALASRPSFWRKASTADHGSWEPEPTHTRAVLEAAAAMVLVWDAVKCPIWRPSAACPPP